MVKYFQNVQIPPRPDQGWEKRCGVSGFFPKCTKYKLVVFDTLVRLVFFSLPTIANSQGFAYNPTSNFHEIQLPNRNVSGLGFRVPEKFCESSPLWRHVFWEELNIQFCNFCWSTFFARIFCWSTIFALHFLLINIFPTFFEIFCWSTIFAMSFLLINIFCKIFLLINSFGIFSLCFLRSKDHLRRSAGGSQDGGTALAKRHFWISFWISFDDEW